MPYVKAADGVKLYYEEAGSGLPLVFVHEFGGDYRSFEQQMRYFSRRYRCIAYNARGYPPSDVPDNPAQYSQEHARDDVLAVLDGLGIDKAHVAGVSMGASATLHFGLKYPQRARSLVVCGCGTGSEPDKVAQFRRDCEAQAHRFETRTMQEVVDAGYALGASRVQLQNKDPRGWEEFRAHLVEHSPRGAALTMRGVQGRRVSIYELTEGMKKLTVPALIVCGDEDDNCVMPSILMKRNIPSAGLVMLPRTGHAVNLEEPALFNSMADEFMHQVEAGRWTLRDPRSITDRIL